MNLFTLALRNLKRRPVRTGLCVVGIAVAVGTALALLALVRSVEVSAREGLGEIGGDLIVMPKNAIGLFGGFIPDSAVERMGAIPGVAQAAGALVMFAPGGDASALLTFGWPGGSPLWKKVPLRQGRIPGDDERHVAVLGEAAAAAQGKKLNDDVDLFGQSFRVVGIAAFASSVNRSAVITPLADLQEASYRPRQVTLVHVGLEDAGDRAGAARIRDAIEATAAVVAAPAAEALSHARSFTAIEAVALAAAIIAAVMSGLNVVTATAMAVQERTREIGIFSAVGWSGRRIMESIVIEGFLLWAIGCTLGVALIFAVSYAVPFIPVIGRLIAFRPAAAPIWPVLAGALALCLLGAFLPAWRAARMLPADALRR